MYLKLKSYYDILIAETNYNSALPMTMDFHQKLLCSLSLPVIYTYDIWLLSIKSTHSNTGEQGL